MKYESAKQLKDAGFPQESRNYEAYGTKGELVKYCLECGDWNDVFACSIPLLSELIEACVKNMPPVARPFFTLSWSKSRWHALVPTIFTDHDLGEVFNGIGDSPEEAVANLWLALNKK
jgi:hypothetical protein